MSETPENRQARLFLIAYNLENYAMMREEQATAVAEGRTGGPYPNMVFESLEHEVQQKITWAKRSRHEADVYLDLAVGVKA